uniref:Uncharacterized protein n=1 Tax=Lygus hesperus TaxID=30085 RepID=A0A0A9XQK9_LYGHE
MLSTSGEVEWDEYVGDTVVGGVANDAAQHAVDTQNVSQQNDVEDIYLYASDPSSCSLETLVPNALCVSRELQDNILENSTIAVTEGAHAKQALLEDYFA